MLPKMIQVNRNILKMTEKEAIVKRLRKGLPMDRHMNIQGGRNTKNQSPKDKILIRIRKTELMIKALQITKVKVVTRKYI